jgi:hypothetical protein
MKFTKLILSTLLVSTAALLVACGGGESATTPAAGGGGGGGGGGNDPAGCTTLTYGANTGLTGVTNPHVNGSKICFLASTTQLQFQGKTLTSPVQNTALSAPFSGYGFTDGAIATYEVIFKNGALYEINVINPVVFFGQFAP